ncbi:MAG: hypothetical protein ACKVP0_27340 [Pirellulaceae bacterium]
MSATTPETARPSSASGSIPAWITSGALGLALGAGAMYLGLNLWGPELGKEKAVAPKSASGGPPPMPGGGGGPMMGGMGGGGMGMGGMGGGGMGGMGGGGGGKRNLTALVGKLELLSRADLKLHVELDSEQSKKVAAKLAEIDKAEKMTADEAQTHLDALEGLLSPEQKTTLELVSLPFGRGGAGGGRGGGRGAAGRPGAGAATPAATAAPAGAPPAPMAMGGGMGGMGGGSPDENPFTQEANQKRLRDLLGRLAPGSSDGATKAESLKEPTTEKPAEK